MPLSILVAILLAFGLGLPTKDSPLARADALERTGLVGCGLAAIGGLALALGLGLRAWKARRGRVTPAMRRIFAIGARLIVALELVGYGMALVWVDWPRVVGFGLGVRGWPLVDEVLILLPFLAAQGLGWWGLYYGERALRPGLTGASAWRHVAAKGRQSLGVVLPMALIYTGGRDLLRWVRPRALEDPIGQFLAVAAMAAFILVLAPAFIRLAWPTRRLEPGPLRDRLERLARRLRFRCTDILVWETNGTLVNAGVTGAVPWFRYVLLTDALIDNLDGREIEAVFGHEVGHIAHRHLPFFGFFILGSMGVLALLSMALSRWCDPGPWLVEQLGATAAEIVTACVALMVLAGYFVVVFGWLSRRFERQADLFGCRAVSCGRLTCPPHEDIDGAPTPAPAGVRALCPVGIRTFANALAEVAALSGVEESARSWRHGSIRRRITFLEGLEGRPEAERRFDSGTRRLRLALALVLVAATAGAAIAVYGPGAGPALAR